ncbi:MAG: hypothetical protein D6690_03045 [Nitrospirae bacterium]|nr:MAG: hypothetical protein D6690_03045 [Nitrospirota bacterium]
MMTSTIPSYPWCAALVGWLLLAACASPQPFAEVRSVHAPSEDVPTMFGRIHVVQRGSIARIYPPVVRFFELYSPTLDRRFHVEVDAAQAFFALAIPPGEYVLTRVQITEGAFRGMAQVHQPFEVEPTGITYVGAWTLTLAPPRYDRTMELSIVSEPIAATAEFMARYPAFDGPVHTAFPESEAVIAPTTRLWEIYPYPRYKYFLRHHPT